MSRLISALGLLAVLLGGPAVMGLAPSATADPARTVAPGAAGAADPRPLAGYVDMVLDEDHQHLFLSQGTDQVLVTDLDGNEVAALPLPDSTYLALSDDGSTLYVALTSEAAIAAVDTATLAVVRTYPVAGGSCPRSIAYTSGIVYYADDCTQQTGPIRGVRVDDGTLFDTTALEDSNPLLVTDPAVPGTLAVGEMRVDPGNIDVYDLDHDGQPTLSERASLADRYYGGLDDLTFDAGGTRLVAAFHDAPRHLQYRTSDLGHAGAYTSADGPTAVDVRSDGLAATGVASGAGVFLYRPGTSDPYRQVAFGGTSTAVARHGLVLGPTQAYVVTSAPGLSSGFVLHVVRIVPEQSTLSLTLSARQVQAGRPVDLRAHLASAEPDAAELAAYLVGPGDERRLLARGTTDADGTWRARVRLFGSGRIEVAYPGSDQVAPSTAARHVTVHARVAAQLLRARHAAHGVATYRAGDRVPVATRVGPAAPGTCVRAQLQERRRGHWHTATHSPCSQLDVDGTARPTLVVGAGEIGRPVRVRAVTAGTTEVAGGHSTWRSVEVER